MSTAVAVGRAVGLLVLGGRGHREDVGDGRRGDVGDGPEPRARRATSTSARSTTALVSANGRVGYVTAPSSDGTNKGSVGTLTAAGTAVDGQVAVGALTATRTDIGTRSSAQLVGADVDVLAENLVTTGDVESSAMCPVGGTPAVQSNVVGLQGAR